MSAADHLQPLQFKHIVTGPGAYKIEAYHPDEGHVGNMLVDSSNGAIAELRTRPDVRRRGVATAMFNHAQQYDPPAKHATQRTPEGNAFAKSTGAYVPRLKKDIPSESSLGLSYEEAMRMSKD